MIILWTMVCAMVVIIWLNIFRLYRTAGALLDLHKSTAQVLRDFHDLARDQNVILLEAANRLGIEVPDHLKQEAS